MSFFDKKQEVVDIQLTRFGKNSLARGVFKPVYYQFFDDDIIYSIDRAGASEGQNESEPRIKEGIRLRTQHTTVQLEKSFDEQKKLIQEGKRGTFEKLKKQMDPIAADKLLKYPMAVSKIGSQTTPSFSLTAYSATISGSAKYDELSKNGIFLGHRPQLAFKPTYSFLIDRTRAQALDDADVVTGTEHFVDLTKEETEFLDKSRVKRTTENIIIDLEEHMTSYGLDNFELEIFEETEPGSDQYVKILEESRIYGLVNITTDESVKEVPPNQIRSRNFYSE